MIRRELTVTLVFDESNTEEQISETIDICMNALTNMEERYLHRLDVEEDIYARDNDFECECVDCLKEKREANTKLH